MAFFGKNKSNETDSASFPGTTAPSGAGGRGDGGHREARHAVIGPLIRIQGELSGDEDILVEGMTFSMEPGLFAPTEGFGYNPSECVLVAKDSGVAMSSKPLTKEWHFLKL